MDHTAHLSNNVQLTQAFPNSTIMDTLSDDVDTQLMELPRFVIMHYFNYYKL